MASKNDQLIFELCKDANYLITTDGKIQTRVQMNGKLGEHWRVAGSTNESGYLVVRYHRVNLRVHRIIWAKFKGYLRSELVINHIDGDKTNNQLENLELITQGKNEEHSYRNLGKNPNRGAAKLSWGDIDNIRKDRQINDYTLRKLAEKYGTTLSTIQGICSGRLYREELKDGTN